MSLPFNTACFTTKAEASVYVTKLYGSGKAYDCEAKYHRERGWWVNVNWKSGSTAPLTWHEVHQLNGFEAIDYSKIETRILALYGDDDNEGTKGRA